MRTILGADGIVLSYVVRVILWAICRVKGQMQNGTSSTPTCQSTPLRGTFRHTLLSDNSVKEIKNGTERSAISSLRI